MNMKHVGRVVSSKRKVIVAYRVVPGEPNNCIVVTTENLAADEHDALIKLVESDAGQTSKDLADAMARTRLSDGRIMLPAFHKTGKMVKMATSNVEMIPNRNTTILLSELNDIIAEQLGVSVSDLAQGDNVKAKTAELVAESQVANIANDDVLTDDKLAAKYRSDADRLSKEAAVLRRQAEELVPTKKKAAPKKTAASA
jgi:hypothetical protein|tara:strand:- start:792 stop:1388 length:597 start_codon:yes stop_codon:yes gene_type:complete